VTIQSTAAKRENTLAMLRKDRLPVFSSYLMVITLAPATGVVLPLLSLFDTIVTLLLPDNGNGNGNGNRVGEGSSCNKEGDADIEVVADVG
jgi:hypothetical protein